ncbi:MAG: hypothetical protein VB031_07955 [Eubacteriaceae bacterium]|nr:hypothetical protein [Eubacteriaceae bacterium]
MSGDGNKAAELKLDTLNQYYEIPLEIESEYDAFEQAVLKLGEECTEYMEFEEKYTAMGLDKQYIDLSMKCKLKPQDKMSVKDTLGAVKDGYKETVKDKKGRKAWGKEILESAASMAQTEAESEIIAKSKEKRIKAGVDDDFSRAHNAADAAGNIAKRLFGRKK